MRATCLRISAATRHRHRQVGLAGAGRADAEHDVVVADRVDVRLLRDALRRDRALVRRDVDRIEEDLAQVGVVIGG